MNSTGTGKSEWATNRGESLARAIMGMSSPEAETRVLSATEIYRTGRALADHAVYPWWADEELATLLEGSNPAVTVGLAVTPEHFEEIHEACGLPRLADVPPDQDAREFEIHVPGGPSLDILTTIDPAGSGAIAKYLQKLGEGIQQIEYRCKDVDGAARILKTRFGVQPVYPEARPGADGAQVNFFLVAAPGSSKVLIELYEPAPRMD
jgi:hypothetical protein